MADDATLAALLMGGGNDVTTGDVAKRIARNDRRSNPRPVTTLRGSIIEHRVPIEERDYAGDAKAIAARAADPMGIPSAAVGMYSPDAREAWRGAYEGNTGASILGDVLSAPALGPVARGASEAMRAAPKLASMLATGVGLTAAPDEAEAAKLTKAQQRQMEMEGTRSKLEAEREAAKLKAAAEADAMRAQSQAAIRAQEREMEAKLAEEAKKREAERPFRERNPVLNSWWPAIATAAGAGTGAAIKAGETAIKSMAARRMGDAVTRAEAALAGTDPVAKTLALKELEAFNAAKAGGGGLADMLKGGAKTVGAAGTGGFVGTEIGLFPDRMDRASLPAGSPDREAAEKRLTPDAQWSNFALNALAGGSGYKLAGAIPPGMAPVERSQALADLLRKGFSADAKTVSKNAGRPVQFQAGAQGPQEAPSPSGTASASSGSRTTQPETGSTAGASKRSTAPEARTSTPKSSKASASDAPHYERQNRTENGTFAPGFKDEK